VAEKVALTDKNKYITMQEIAIELKEGIKGVGGSGVYGKKMIIER